MIRTPLIEAAAAQRAIPIRAVAQAVAATFLLLPAALPAVVVHGTVRDPLGRAIPSARVQLVQGTQVVASTVALTNGSYEIRSTAAGRFLLISAAAGFSPHVTEPFFGRDLDLITRDMEMTISPVREEISVTATGAPLPVEQSSATGAMIAEAALSTRADLVEELRLQPGVSVVQTGGNGGATSLFVRGADSASNQVLIDGVPSNQIGGVFDYGNVATTAVSNFEVRRGPDSAVFGTGALGGAVRFETPRGASLQPVLQYSGDAGNFHTWRNEAELSGTRGKLDAYTAFSRFDSSNALPNDRFHVATAAANLGYSLSGTTSLRGTVRHSASAIGTPGAFDFAGLTQLGREGDQNTYVSGVLDTSFRDRLHSVVRYIGARKREQSFQFAPVGEAVPQFYQDQFIGNTYYGNTVTIRGANGTVGTGQAAVAYDPFPTRLDLVSNRDGVEYQGDTHLGSHLTAVLQFRYTDERGLYRYPAFGSDQQIERTNYDYALDLHGDVKGRVFYTLGGAIEKNSLFGTEGTPQIGIAGYPVRPGAGWMHGTKLRFNFAKGVQEPNLFAQESSLLTALQQAADTTDIATYNVGPIGAQRSRSYEGGIDQNIYTDRFVLHATYFHNEFGRQIEYVAAPDIQQYFGIPVAKVIYGAYLNSLDFSAQGVEGELQARPTTHLFFRAGYTYLLSRVQRSFSGDETAVLGGFANENPNYPGVAIGSSSPLVGGRPFLRAPHTGFAVAEYTANRLSASVRGAFSSRSDDSTFLGYSDRNGGNTLLLPNRDLAFGYARVDANATVRITPSVRVFTELDNLLGQQHTGPIGYPGLPFTFRAGVKLRLTRE